MCPEIPDSSVRLATLDEETHSAYLALCQQVLNLHHQQARETREPQWRMAQQMQELGFRATDLVAAARGWKRARHNFSLRQLRRGSPGKAWPTDYKGLRRDLCDHAECFRHPEWPRRPAAIIAHLYRTDREGIVADAQAEGLRVEFLPESCYLKGRTVSVILLPGAAASVAP